MAHRRGVVGTHGRNIYQLSAERGHAGVPPEWAEQPYLPTSLPPKRGRSRSGHPAAAAGREQVKSRFPPAPGLPIPPTASPRRSGVPLGAGSPGWGRAPRGARAALRGQSPGGRVRGVGGGRAPRLFASTRKHQQRAGGRIGGGGSGGGSETGRPSGPRSCYRAQQRPPSHAVPGLCAARPAGSRCPGATGRARRGGPALRHHRCQSAGARRGSRREP